MMEMTPRFAPEWLGFLDGWDAAALAWLILSHWFVGWLVRHHPMGWRSTGEMVAEYRRVWMRRAARREIRIQDVALLTALRQGASFLASMTMFALGGAVALLGQSDLLVTLMQEVTGGPAAPHAAQQVKLLCLIAMLAYAFLKLVWSIRVFGYCAVVMGALPGPIDENSDPGDTEEDLLREADRAAELNRIAARNFNKGLGAIYYALAMLAWFLGPLAFFLATTLTTAMLIRREFRSETRKALRFGAFR